MVRIPGARRLMPSTARPARRRDARHAGDDYGATAEPSWREVDWPAHVRQTKIAGRTVNYVARGEGRDPPVVLIHGLDGCWQNWLETIPRISTVRRVIALDLPGFGDSQPPEGDISISGYADCVDELCDQLETGPVVVVGNSMGGFTAAELAIRHPARTESLVLANPAGMSTTDVFRRPAMTAARLAFAITQHFTAAAYARSMIARPGGRHLAVAYVFRHPSRLAADLLWEQVSRAGSPCFLEALETLLGWDFRDRLPEIACPTLLVWGKEDVVISSDDAEEYERLIPDARKVVLEDTGHVPMVERPQRFNDLLIDFLAERRRSGGLEAAA